MNRAAALRVAIMLLVAALLAARVGCGRKPTVPVPVARGPAGASSGEGGEERAAGLAPEPGGAPLTAIAGTLVDQDGRARGLSEFRGAPFVATLVYTRCPSVCPRIVAELKRLERAVPPPDPASPGASPRFILFSLDPANDTPEVLRAFAAEHALERARWELLAPDTSMLGKIAGALGVAWRAEGGGIAHSAVIAVVDRAGRVRHRRIGLDVDVAALEAAWRDVGMAGQRPAD